MVKPLSERLGDLSFRANGLIEADYEHQCSVLYREFTDALTEVLSENAANPPRRGRLARARAAVKRQPDLSEHEYFVAVETAFAQWQTLQNVCRRDS
jgi:hypothetical protein